VGIGVGGHGRMPCFHLDPDRFLQSIMQRFNKTLYDIPLLQELHGARQGLDNGITTWNAERETCVLKDVLQYYGQSSSSTLVLVLSPSGVLLTPTSLAERRETDDIVFDGT